MILCQHLVSVTLILDGLPRQHMAKPVPDDLLYSRVTVQAEAQNVVEIGTADRIEDSQLLGADDRRQRRVTSDCQELGQRLGILAVQHIIQDV